MAEADQTFSIRDGMLVSCCSVWLFRNISRNRRRSIDDGLAGRDGRPGAAAVRRASRPIFSPVWRPGLCKDGGHLTVYRSGYFLFGPGNPAAYGIDDHPALMRDIEADPVLHDLIAVITPTQSRRRDRRQLFWRRQRLEDVLRHRPGRHRSADDAAMERIRRQPALCRPTTG